jgi:hypothetical protein
MGSLPRGEIASRRVRRHFGLASFELCQLLVSDQARRDLRAEGLEQNAMRVNRLKMRWIEAHDSGPSLWLRVDKTLFLEHPNRFSHRRPAHAEPRGQFYLVQDGSWRERPVQDEAAQVRMNRASRVIPGKTRNRRYLLQGVHLTRECSWTAARA